MLRKMYSVFLSILISLLFIFLFNLAFSSINLYIGINPVSLSLITLLGVPGIVPLVLAAILF